MTNLLLNLDVFMAIFEAIQTFSKASTSDLVITIVLFLLIKGYLKFELKISLNSNPQKTKHDNDKNKTT